jgi:hypothetical protein
VANFLHPRKNTSGSAVLESQNNLIKSNCHPMISNPLDFQQFLGLFIFERFCTNQKCKMASRLKGGLPFLNFKQAEWSK